MEGPDDGKVPAIVGQQLGGSGAGWMRDLRELSTNLQRAARHHVRVISFVIFVLVIFFLLHARRPVPRSLKQLHHHQVNRETSERERALGLSPGWGEFHGMPRKPYGWEESDSTSAAPSDLGWSHGPVGAENPSDASSAWRDSPDVPADGAWTDNLNDNQQGGGGGYDEYGRDGGQGRQPFDTRHRRRGWDDLDDGRQYGSDQDWQQVLEDEELLRRRRSRLHVKKPPLTVDDVKAELRRLEASEQLAIVKLRLRELEEQRKARQRVMDEYDFGDEQDAFRNKEREWQRSKWNHEEKKFYAWFNQAQQGNGEETPARSHAQLPGGAVAQLPSACSQFNTLLQRFKPYSEYVRSIQDTELAYVTFVTSPEFVPPAAVLMHSIAVSGSQYARAICVTKDISERDRQTLSLLAQIIEIEKIPSPKYVDNARYREVFTKLRIWQLGMFKRVVYVDTDVIVVHNMDDLFDVEEWGVPMDAENNRYSTGLMVIDPKDATFDDMMAKLKTTSVSMELPDLLFLKEYFDSNKRKINIIPRWYQVYQEEFGSQYASYLTRRKQKITVFDPRIHGIHYPGAGKPWGGDTNYKLNKYKPKFCSWRDAEEFRYEPQFLWYLHHELMLTSLSSAKSSALFDFESGGGVIVLSEWSAARKKAQEEQRRSPYGYSAPWQRSSDATPAPNDYKWVYKDGRWVKEGAPAPSDATPAPTTIAWSPSACKYVLTWDGALETPNASLPDATTLSPYALSTALPSSSTYGPRSADIYAGRRNPYTKHNYRGGGYNLQQLRQDGEEDGDRLPLGATRRSGRKALQDDEGDSSPLPRRGRSKVSDDSSAAETEAPQVQRRRFAYRSPVATRASDADDRTPEPFAGPTDSSLDDALHDQQPDRRGRRREFVPPKRQQVNRKGMEAPDSSDGETDSLPKVPKRRHTYEPLKLEKMKPLLGPSDSPTSAASSSSSDDELRNAVADLLPPPTQKKKAPRGFGTLRGDPPTKAPEPPHTTRLRWFGEPSDDGSSSSSTAAPTPAPTVPSPKGPVLAASIDFSRVQPFAAKLPQKWDGSDLEQYLWLITWCTKTNLHVATDQACGKASHISQFSGGMCRTNFDGAFTVSPIFASSAADLRLLRSSTAAPTVLPNVTQRKGIKHEALKPNGEEEASDDGLVRRSTKKATTAAPRPPSNDDSSSSSSSDVRDADHAAAAKLLRTTTASHSMDAQLNDTALEALYVTALPAAYRSRHGVEGIAGVVFRANSVLTDYPARTKWFEAVIRCDPSLPKHTVELEYNATNVLVETIQGKHDRLYTIRLRSRCACLGGCDEADRFSAQYNASFREWKRRMLRPSGESIADRCARRSSSPTHKRSSPLCLSQCAMDARTNQCKASTAKWLLAAERAQGHYCNCSHVGGNGDKRYTLAECEAEAEAADANVINFVSSSTDSNMWDSSSAPPTTKAQHVAPVNEVEQKGCFYKKCALSQLLQGRPSLGKYRPATPKDPVRGFDVYFLNPFFAVEETPAPTTSQPETPRPTSRFWNW